MEFYHFNTEFLVHFHTFHNHKNDPSSKRMGSNTDEITSVVKIKFRVIWGNLDTFWATFMKTFQVSWSKVKVISSQKNQIGRNTMLVMLPMFCLLHWLRLKENTSDVHYSHRNSCMKCQVGFDSIWELNLSLKFFFSF